MEGFSKFGSYLGNGSSDGPVITLNFRPAWVMLKKVTGAANNWTISDTTRTPYNGRDDVLRAELPNVEQPSGDAPIDHLSNGFKIRNGTGHQTNTSGETYIYCAFAESPFGGSDVAQARAR